MLIKETLMFIVLLALSVLQVGRAISSFRVDVIIGHAEILERWWLISFPTIHV